MTLHLVRLLVSKYVLWIMLAIPAWPYLSELLMPDRYYPEMMQRSGLLSIQLLALTLSVSPISLLLRFWSPLKPVALWLLRNRRYFGLASAAYALIHTLLYLRQIAFDWELAWLEGLEWPFATGWISLFLLAAISVISNDYFVRKLASHWKNLQRFSYIAVIAGFIHWLMLDFFIRDAMQWIIPLAILKCVQITFRANLLNTSNN